MNHSIEHVATIQKELIEKVLEFVDVKFIYLSPESPTLRCFTILIDREQETIPASIVTGVRNIFENFPGFNHRTYTINYAYQELEKGNLYFIRTCMYGNLIYSQQGCESYRYTEAAKRDALQKTNDWFQTEVGKIESFLEGAVFYKKRKKWNQAGFLMHQTIELLYRCLEYFTMGKSLACHKISNHVNYVKPFSPRAGSLFTTKNRAEKQLLTILENAYCDSRYTNDYDITKKEVKILLKRAKILQNEVEEVFEFTLGDCKENTNILSKDTDYNQNVLPVTIDDDLNKKRDLGIIIDILQQELKVIKIVCFGVRKAYQKRSSSKDKPEIRSFQNYDLLVITKETATIPPTRVSQLVSVKTQYKIAATIILASESKIKKALKKGNRFLNEVFTHGESVYSDPNIPTNFSANKLSSQEWFKKAEQDWKVRKSRAELFFQAADSIAGDDDHTEGALLYLALQQICLGILYVNWGFRPDNLNLKYLIQLCGNFSKAAEQSFAMHSPEERRLSEKLFSSLIDAQFKTRQKQSLVDEGILLNKSRSFKNEMENLAERKLEQLKSETSN